MQSKQLRPSTNTRYIFLQGCFWMLYCTTVSFVSMCLQGRGLENREIGIVTASFGIISAMLQPFLGRVCDRSPHMNWRKMIIILCIPTIITFALMTFIPGRVTGILFVGCLLLLGNTILPFINGALSDYQQHQVPVNFGIARGTGSFTFAVLAYFIGKWAVDYGEGAVSVSGIVIAILMMLIALWMPCYASGTAAPAGSGQKKKGFITRYPAFIVMFLAFAVLSTSHNMAGTYLLQILQSLGGGSEEYGLAIALQAIVEMPVMFAFAKLMKKFSVRKIMLVAAAGYVLKAITYAMAGSVMAIYMVQFTQMVSFALFASASVYYTLLEVEPEDQVTGQALMTSVMAVGTVLGSLIGGVMIDWLGMKSMLTMNVFVSAAGIVLAFVSELVIAPARRKKGV